MSTFLKHKLLIISFMQFSLFWKFSKVITRPLTNQIVHHTLIISIFQGSHQIHGKESITEESAKILLKRGLKKVTSEENEDVWEFTRDLKHRITSLYGYPQEVIQTLASEVKCPHLIVKAINGNLYEAPENIKEVLDIYQRTNPLYKRVDVEGNHHVHLNNPSNVWPHIEAFLENTKL